MTLPRGKWILKMKRELNERRSRNAKKKYNTTATKRIMVPDARLLACQLARSLTHSPARTHSSKYCSFAQMQKHRMDAFSFVVFFFFYFFIIFFAIAVLIFYLFGILCSFLINIVNGKNVLSWRVSHSGPFVPFFLVLTCFSFCHWFHSNARNPYTISCTRKLFCTFRCAYTRLTRSCSSLFRAFFFGLLRFGSVHL